MGEFMGVFLVELMGEFVLMGKKCMYAFVAQFLINLRMNLRMYEFTG